VNLIKNLPRIAVAACALALAQAATPPQPSDLQLTPVTAEVLTPPQAVTGSDGRRHLLYEIRIANLTAARLAVQRIEVRDGHGATLQQMDAAAIAQRLCVGGRRGSESGELGGSQFGVAFMHVTVPANAPLPQQLTHVIEGFADKAGASFTLRAARVMVDTREPPSLAPPLRGEGLVVGDGCCDTIRHVRALLPLDGTLYLAQRFAIDFEQVDATGRIFTGDSKVVGNYRIYGKPIFAVADGTVVAARNDLNDQMPGKLPDGLPLDQADGNFAIVALGGDAYALYAHMRPGSVLVSAGSKVRRGEKIGAVGNSGNTQAPHLHFQLMDAAGGLAANGVPYVFDSYRVTAVDEAGTADFDRAEASGTPMTLTRRTPPLQGHGSLPLDLSIVSWPP
jgi:Peptidase family M23